jgi:hypothetical protein
LQDNVAVLAGDREKKSLYIQALSSAIDALEKVLALPEGVDVEVQSYLRNSQASAVTARNILAAEMFNHVDLANYRRLYAMHGRAFASILPTEVPAEEIEKYLMIHAAHNRSPNRD